MQQELVEKDIALSAETAKRQTMEEYIDQLKQQLAEMRQDSCPDCGGLQ